jgi:hypothetical protein
MTAEEIIEEIKRLPPKERNRVTEFARRNSGNGQLSGEELGRLAQQMVDTDDPAEAKRLRQEIIRGFYGEEIPK